MQAKSVVTHLKKHGISPIKFQESNDPQVEDGEVTITDDLYVQVGVFEPYLMLHRWQDDETILHLGEFKTISSLANKIKEVTQ